MGKAKEVREGEKEVRAKTKSRELGEFSLKVLCRTQLFSKSLVLNVFGPERASKALQIRETYC